MELRRAFHISRQYASSNLLSQLVNSVHDVWLRTPHFKDLEKFLTVRAFPSNRRRVQGLGADSTERMVGELMEVGVELTTKIEKKKDLPGVRCHHCYALSSPHRRASSVAGLIDAHHCFRMFSTRR